MAGSPQISVILPVYNSALYVAETITSLLNQTFSDFELIILNDGSQDDSERIIQSFSDPRIQFIRNEKNIGLIATLNKGLKLAQGEFIARMDADDNALPNRFEKQVNFLTAHPDYGVCGTQISYFGNTSHPNSNLPGDDEDIRLTLLFRTALAHPSVMMRKSVLSQENLNYNSEFPSAEDYQLWTLFALKSKLANLPETLLQYRLHENQITQTKVDQKEASLKKTQKHYLTAIGLTPDINELELHYRFSGGRGARTEKELTDSINWLSKLRAHLLQIHFASENKVNAILTRELRKCCENSGLGKVAVKIWNACTWKTPHPSLKEKMRFYFKLFTRYKAH